MDANITCTKPRKQDWSPRDSGPCGCIECEIDRRVQEKALAFRVTQAAGPQKPWLGSTATLEELRAHVRTWFPMTSRA